MAWTVFEYLYRDADNYKSFGSVALEGSVSAERWASALGRLEDGTYFIAEQIGLPPLYDELYRWSAGVPTDADHCWHEYVSHAVVGESDLSRSISKVGTAEAVVQHLLMVETWNIGLSPNVA